MLALSVVLSFGKVNLICGDCEISFAGVAF